MPAVHSHRFVASSLIENALLCSLRHCLVILGEFSGVLGGGAKIPCHGLAVNGSVWAAWMLHLMHVRIGLILGGLLDVLRGFSLELRCFGGVVVRDTLVILGGFRIADESFQLILLQDLGIIRRRWYRNNPHQHHYRSGQQRRSECPSIHQMVRHVLISLSSLNSWRDRSRRGFQPSGRGWVNFLFASFHPMQSTWHAVRISHTV
jgi:hypothetical protein